MPELQPIDRAQATRGAWSVLALVVLGYALALWRSAPPAAQPLDAPAGTFSAARALLHLERIEGSGRPHPIGSLENARVRGEITRALETLGLDVATDERLAVGANGVVAIPRNIVTRIQGRTHAPCVLIAAHHDSVSAGPGTSDDGVGVAAILEIARALVADETLERDVILLIDDGEEAGLIGDRKSVV